MKELDQLRHAAAKALVDLTNSPAPKLSAPQKTQKALWAVDALTNYTIAASILDHETVLSALQLTAANTPDKPPTPVPDDDPSIQNDDPTF